MQHQKQVLKNLSKHPQKLTLLYQRRSALKKLAKADLASCEEYKAYKKKHCFEGQYAFQVKFWIVNISSIGKCWSHLHILRWSLEIESIGNANLVTNYIFIKLPPKFRFLPSDSVLRKQRVLPCRAARKLQLVALSIPRPGKCWTFQEILRFFRPRANWRALTL